MTHHHLLDDDRPLDRPWTPATRREIVAEMTARIRALEADANGNVHRRDVLDALTNDA